MQVAASKQTDIQGRVEFQNIVAAARINEKPTAVEGVDDLVETKPIDSQKEHEKEGAEEQSGEKEEETLRRYKKIKENLEKNELFESLPYHILDIRV